MSSILTNTSAMVALQTLKAVNSNLAKTQDMISTGKDIARAKDNSSIWAISKVMESDVDGFNAISKALAVGESTVAVASAAADQIVTVLKEMKELAVNASSESSDHAAIERDMVQKREQITQIIAAAQFNGANLMLDDIDGNGATSLTVVSSLDRVGGAAPVVSTIDVATTGFETSLDYAAGGESLSAMTNITDAATAQTALTEIEAYLDTAIQGAATLGASEKRISNQGDFISKLTDAMKAGIGSLVDADMEAASARLQSLQVQQQLATQSLSIANQAPQSILALFR